MQTRQFTIHEIKMTKLYLYIVASSKNPDTVTCPVPSISDCKTQIFFGPCKKRLREKLREDYLRTGTHNPPYYENFLFEKNTGNHEEDISLNKDNNELDKKKHKIYIIGINGGQPKKIVWCGRIFRVMTFAKAYGLINENEYEVKFSNMLKRKDNPLHVKPYYDEENKLKGYELISEEHKKNDLWMWDLMKPTKENKKRGLPIDGKLSLKPNEDPYKIFDRDCCFLCENIFWATETGGGGIVINDEMLCLLKKHQKLIGNAITVNSNAPFGKRKNGSIYGLTGNHLEFEGDEAEKFIAYLKNAP